MQNRLNPELSAKLDALEALLQSFGSAAVAYSAGVDSTLLLAVAQRALGDNVVAITACSPAYPERETDEARAFCAERGIRHVMFDTQELDIEGFSHNPENRCYLCKTDLFGRIIEIAHEQGMAVVVEGSNLDDLGDFRPGRQAIEEMEVKSPLLEAGLSKQDIRDISQHLGLPTWNKQSFACLYSRFAYGDLLTTERLAMVDAAEQVLLDLGLSTVRVRMNDTTARIEAAPGEFDTIMQNRAHVVDALKDIGFSYVSLDLQGYRTGSMNEVL